jgi:hypothetical protein
MVATKLDGTAIAKGIRERLGQEIADKQKLNPRFKPTLKIIQGAPLCLCLDFRKSQSLKLNLLLPSLSPIQSHPV